MRRANWRRLLPATLPLAPLLVVTTAAAQEPPPLIWGVQLEQLEYRLDDDADVVAWDGDAVVGTDEWKVRLSSEGEFDRDEDAFEVLEHQLTVQRPVSDFFDAKAGLRFDAPAGPNRVYLVAGFHGLAPQWFEVDADLFLSERGDLSARLEAEYELLITNRLILVPSVEVDMAASSDEAIGVGAGLVGTEVGLRLQYDVVDRSVSPYVGLHWEAAHGKTRDLARADGESTSNLYVVAGVRLSF